MLDVKRSDSECYVPGDFTSLIRNTLSCPVSAVFDNWQPDERVVTRFCVARIPRWESPWCELNTLRRRAFGTYFVDRYIAIYLCYGRENVFFSVVTRMYRSWRNRVARCHFLARWREFGRLRTSQSLRCVKERRQLCCPDLLHNGCRSWIVRRNWDTEIVEANISLDVD